MLGGPWPTSRPSHVLLLLLATPLLLQQDPHGVLRALASTQCEEKALPPVSSFAMRVSLQDRSEVPREFIFDLLYSTEPERVRLTVDDPKRGVKVEKGFDNEKFWLYSNNQGVINLSGREYTKDREAIEATLDLSRDLLLVLDVARIEENAQNLSMDSGGIVGNLFDEEEGHLIFRINVNVDDPKALPQSLILFRHPTELFVPPRKFVFDAWKSFNGRKIPRLIEEYSDLSEELPVRIIEVQDFLWKKPLSAKIFAPPSSGD